MELSSQRLLFECASGTSSPAVLTVTNTGSTALYYRWERIAPPPGRHQAPVLFHLHDQTGSVLPAALHTFWSAAHLPFTAVLAPPMLQSRWLSVPRLCAFTEAAGQLLDSLSN